MKLTQIIVLSIAVFLVVSAKPKRATRHHGEKPDHDGGKKHHGKNPSMPMIGGGAMCRVPPLVPEGCELPKSGMPESKSWRLNNGIGEPSMAVESMQSDLVKHLNDNLDETPCETKYDDEVKDLKMRGPQVTLKVTCDGDDKPHYATFEINTHSYSILEDKRTMNKMPGGYFPACELGQVFNYFMAYARKEYPDEDHIKIGTPYCLVKSSVRNGMYFCPIELAHTSFNMELTPLNEPEIKLVEVKTTPSSMCMQKLTKEYAIELLENSTGNTMVFLEKHCGFEGNMEDLKVGNGSFVDLATGTQFCIQVYTDTFGDDDKNTTLAIYKYKLEGTKPFLVAHPFAGNNGTTYCNHFMMMVADMWGK